jgi:PKD domain
MARRCAHGCALLAVLVAVLAITAGASANTITTVAGGGLVTPLDYTHGGYVDPLTQTLPAPSGIAWSGAASGTFYVVSAGKCVQLWLEPNENSVSRGMGIEGGTWEDCNAFAGGYTASTPAKDVKLKNPCCVTSNWQWDEDEDNPAVGPLVASTGSGHVNFYSWQLNTGVTKAGGSRLANCGDPTNLQESATAPTAGHFCDITALAQQGFASLQGWYAFAERNRGTGQNANILYWVDSIPELHAIPLDPGNSAVPLGIGGLTWDGVGGMVVSDGLSAIHRFQRTGGSWTLYQLAGLRGGNPDFAGDGGGPYAARFDDPNGLAAGFDNALYIADTGNCRIRKYSKISFPSTGNETVTTVAGNGCNGSAMLGDGGPATEANLDHPLGVAMAPTGLLITDTGHNVVRMVDRTTIVNAPAFTADTTPAFDIQSLDTPSHIKCKIDVEVPCDGIGPLGEGTYTLKAWENGGGGNLPDPPDPTPAVATFTVDTTAPGGVSLTSPAPDAAVAVDTDFGWTAGSDGGAGIDHYELFIDGAKNRDVPTSACAGGSCTAKAAAPLAEGAHTWQVRAVDAVTNSSATETRSLTAGGLPNATFAISPNPALVGRSITFDGSASSDESGIAHYEWDLDGDSNFETDGGTSPTTARTYQAPTTITVRLRVTDGTNKQSTAAQTLRVTAPTAAQNLLGVSINNGAQFTRDPNVTLTVKPPATANAFVVSNDGGFFAPATFPAASTIKWKLDSSGPERLPKTVYLRFMLGPIVSDNYTDDIILDEIPPVVQSASLANSAPARAATAAKAKTYVVKVKAKDSNSGVAKVQVTANKRKPGKLLAYKKTVKVKAAAKPKLVRARDRAGNFSRWKQLR